MGFSVAMYLQREMASSGAARQNCPSTTDSRETRLSATTATLSILGAFAKQLPIKVRIVRNQENLGYGVTLPRPSRPVLETYCSPIQEAGSADCLEGHAHPNYCRLIVGGHGQECFGT
jgi:hypothetical protein